MSGLTVGATTEDSIVERIGLLLDTYLTTILTTVDTQNNALAVDTDRSFTTASPAIVMNEDRGVDIASPFEVIIVATGLVRNMDMEIRDMAPHSTQLPRLDLGTEVALITRVSGTQGSWTQDGGRWRANRIHRALRIILSKYPELDVPDYSGGALDTLVNDTEIVSDELMPDIEEQGWVTYARRLEVMVRTTEYLAEP